MDDTGHTMANEPTSQKDNLIPERVSLLVLVLCFGVLVYLLAFRPF